MNNVMISCAVTGSGATTHKSPHVPVTPAQIAASVHAAAQAGAAIAHIHVRDPNTGAESWDMELFRETVQRIRDQGTDILINLTTGFGGDIAVAGAQPDLSGYLNNQLERVAHIAELKPDICSLDCGTLNFGDVVFVNSPSALREMAKVILANGVKPELEVFDLGHLRLANQLHKEGLVGESPLYQFCLGVNWGAGADTESLLTLRNQLPDDARWSAFGVGASQFPMAAQAFLLGGNIRVGLEDNLYLERGVLATNEDLVRKTVDIISALGGAPMTAAQARTYLKLAV